MHLEIDPSPKLGILATDLDLVINVTETGLPSVVVDRGKPLPDRHLLLALAQAAAVAIEERDVELVEFLEPCSITLVREDDRFVPAGPLVIMRNALGKFGILALADHDTVGRLTRRLVQYFTGKIRLDLP